MELKDLKEAHLQLAKILEVEATENVEEIENIKLKAANASIKLVNPFKTTKFGAAFIEKSASILSYPLMHGLMAIHKVDFEVVGTIIQTTKTKKPLVSVVASSKGPKISLLPPCLMNL